MCLEGAQGVQRWMRFPNFSGEWATKRIDEVADLYKGKGIAKAEVSSDGVHQCIRYGELYTVYEEVIENVLSRTSLPSDSLFFSEPYDVIIPSSGETREDIATAACVVPGGVALGGDLNVLRPRENGIFLSYYLNGPLAATIARVAQGDSVVHLYPHQIEKLPIKVPSPEEQGKISECLSSLDDYIRRETRKLDALKTHKQGLMQQLFPTEGQYLPRLRFSGFESGWKRKPLGEVCEVLQGYGFPEVLQGKVSGKYPFCKVSDVSRAVANDAGLLFSAANYVDDIELLQLRAKLIPEGATVFARIGEGLRLNRRAFVLKECLIDNNVVGIKAFNGVADDYFLYLLSQLVDLNEYCGGAIPSVNKTTLESVEVMVPGQDEQERIASCVRSLDGVIAAQSRQIVELRKHKQGLMQGLFPAMTGTKP